MIAIKGWSMPDRCRDCSLCCDIKDGHGDYLYYCGALDAIPDLNKIDVFFGRRPDFCPLVEVPERVSVNDGLPPEGIDVLVWDEDVGVDIGWIDTDGTWQTDDINELDAVTHWQYIF